MLTIGDFARFAGLSVRMLRHYDQLGLLKPTTVDQWSGYRRYDLQLLERAHRLTALRELGFTLAEIGELLEGDSDVWLSALEGRRAELISQLQRDAARLREVERRLQFLKGNTVMQNLARTSLPHLTLVGDRQLVADLAEIGHTVGPLFDRIVCALKAAGQVPTEPGVALYSTNHDQIEITVGFPGVTGVPEGLSRYEAEEVLDAVTHQYHGDMNGIPEAWQSLAADVVGSGLAPTGVCREVYLATDGAQESWITELQQPVAS